MTITVDPTGDVLVIHVQQDRIDAAGAIQFKEQIRAVTQTPHPRVLLDLTPVMFLDSSGLGAIVAVMKLLGPNRRLELSGISATVQKVLHLTRMDTVMTIHATAFSAASTPNASTPIASTPGGA